MNKMEHTYTEGHIMIHHDELVHGQNLWFSNLLYFGEMCYAIYQQHKRDQDYQIEMRIKKGISIF